MYFDHGFPMWISIISEFYLWLLFFLLRSLAVEMCIATVFHQLMRSRARIKCVCRHCGPALSKNRRNGIKNWKIFEKSSPPVFRSFQANTEKKQNIFLCSLVCVNSFALWELWDGNDTQTHTCTMAYTIAHDMKCCYFFLCRTTIFKPRKNVRHRKYRIWKENETHGI